MIKFGTDGWRGVIAEDFTFDNVRICAQGVASYFKQENPDKELSLVIGYDTRFGSKDFAAAAAEVIAGNQIKVYLCSKPTPTPVVSYTVPDTQSDGAIIITASHNPGSWNGFKFRLSRGESASDKTTRRVEKNVAGITSIKEVKRIYLDDALRQGTINYLDPDISYLKHLKTLVDIEELKRHKLSIIVDSMYGAGSGYFKNLLQDGEATLVEIHGEQNPSFPGIQPEPIAKNLAELSIQVVDSEAAVGLATDGDADRLGIIDEQGNFLNQHQVFALLALYLLEVRGERGAIIKSLNCTSMLKRLGEIFTVPVYETPIGFKWVAPLMIRENALVGGEESGGYGFRGHIPERDGILAGLYFLDFMIKTGKSPHQLLDYLYSKVGPHYYDRIDTHISPDSRGDMLKRLSASMPQAIAGSKVLRMDTTDGFRFFTSEDSWLLIRFSGTEPLVRIYAEDESPEKVRELLDEGKKIAGV